MKKIILTTLLTMVISISFQIHPLFSSFAEEKAANSNQDQGANSGAEDGEKVDSVWGAMKFTGNKIKDGSITAGHAIEKGGKAAGHGIVKGGKATGRGFKKAGHSIKTFFAGDGD